MASQHGDASRIAFIGGGNMARAIIGGLLAKGKPEDTIAVADPSPDAQRALVEMGVTRTVDDAGAIVSDADLIVLAVKPQIMRAVASGFRGTIPEGTVVMSIAAGISVKALKSYLGEDVAIVRCMPNTPALVGRGVAGLYADAGVSALQRDLATDAMAAVGSTLWVDHETDIDTVIAVSGSGPAYFFAFMEAMINVAVEMGMDRKTATDLTLQTALGAATLASSVEISVSDLRRNVSSPGGTTEQAVKAFQEGGLETLVREAMLACKSRAEVMTKELE
ncbi:pyrroline-5-carboxylate reductase [Luminiphilus syltensis NOR5-1B]|uniref:Pyrroline-5-carboxylate reductase n=1 Tax=Luminiphilus syltensis NOR5-1B TaxID=565045 RepID=B8KU77_9GAMM|nr:pyrroline-5-carboxylate reductase [Luminiphilus syltensis]EED35508.1 pyrroline-5-carboxylate reductase [Luminiphilus syltensis NOR5-1B]